MESMNAQYAEAVQITDAQLHVAGAKKVYRTPQLTKLGTVKHVTCGVAARTTDVAGASG